MLCLFNNRKLNREKKKHEELFILFQIKSKQVRSHGINACNKIPKLQNIQRTFS